MGWCACVMLVHAVDGHLLFENSMFAVALAFGS